MKRIIAIILSPILFIGILILALFYKLKFYKLRDDDIENELNDPNKTDLL